MSDAATRVFVLFGLYGDLDPGVVTTQLRTTPTSSFEKGELVGNGVAGRVREELGWVVTTDEEPRLSSVIGRRSSVGSGGGPWVTVEKMRRLADLDLDLVVSFYAVD